MGLEYQHISAANFFHEQGMFYDLGAHLSRCEQPELSIMDKGFPFPGYAHQGTKAYVQCMPSSSILKLAKTLQPYPTLWAGFKDGFVDGLDKRLIADSLKPFDAKDLARLAIGIKAFSDLDVLLNDRLAAHGIAINIKPIACEHYEAPCHAVVMSLGADAAPLVFVSRMGELTPAAQLPEYLQDIRAVALAQKLSPL